MAAEKNPERTDTKPNRVDALIDVTDSLTYDGDRTTHDHVSGEPLRRGLVLGDDDPRDADLSEHIVSEDVAWEGKIF